MTVPTTPTRTPPVIGVSCCHRLVGKYGYHMTAAPYVRAAAEGTGGLPLLIPALGDRLAVDALLDRLDGLLLTGSRSNVHPTLYHEEAERIECGPYDPARDATTFPLIRGAIRRGLPLLAICRGYQELNVALGGTLHPRVHEVEAMMDHRDDPDADPDIQFGPAHPVRLTEGGMLATLAGSTTMSVNSLHGQGIDRKADRLIVEALAPDGLIEAARVDPALATDIPVGMDADTDLFSIGVQWHPEWRFEDNPFSTALFAAFGAAARRRASLTAAPNTAN